VCSKIIYLVLQTLSSAPSIYLENAHSLTLVGAVKWLSLGGSLFISSGPTRYYQPLARLTVPVHKHVQWIKVWR
jgi:hypothetical protein